MKFRKEVQEQFKKAGWYEGRDKSSQLKNLRDFNLLPQILQEFLFEYGDLVVETLTKYSHGTLDLTWSDGNNNIQDYIDDPEPFDEDVVVFPVGLYPMDNGYVGCSEEGTIYMIHDYPGIMSNDFIEGIEKVIMEDYSGTKAWDEEDRVWNQKE